MQRLFQLEPHYASRSSFELKDRLEMVSFFSKATSTAGVFRSFLKNPLAKYLKNGTMYSLYVSDFLGYRCVGCAYYNGKAFVKIAYKAVDGKMYTLDKGEIKECQEQ